METGCYMNKAIKVASAIIIGALTPVVLAGRVIAVCATTAVTTNLQVATISKQIICNGRNISAGTNHDG